MTATTAQTWTPWGGYPLPANDNLPSLAPRVVAFTGVAGSGKSTATRYLESKGYMLVKFAAPLKAMMRAIGLTDEELEGSLKERQRIALCDKTPRHAMQTLGTEWGRKCLGDDFWVNLWKFEAERILEAGGRVVTDDCRFPNEAAVVRAMGGDIYRLVGRGGIQGDHESERCDFLHDCLIENDGPLEDLHFAIDGAMRRYG